MKKWLNKNYKSIIIFAFLIPIITVAVVSISHVTTWYGLSNPISWSIYLSVGIEIAALSSLAAIAANMGKKVYFPFIVATIIQFIGNVFFSYSYIDVSSTLFKSWVELVSPVIQLTGVDPTDIIAHKRFLAFFAGGMLPIISLSFLHMLVKFTQVNTENKGSNNIEENPQVIDAKDIISEVSRIRLTEDDLKLLEDRLMKKPLPMKEEQEIIEDEEEPIDEEALERNWMYLNERNKSSFGLSPKEENDLFEGNVPEVISEPIIEVIPEPVQEVIPEVIHEVIPDVISKPILEESIKKIPEGFNEVDGKLVQVLDDITHEITQPHYDIRGDIDGGTLLENGEARGHIDPRGEPGVEGIIGIKTTEDISEIEEPKENFVDEKKKQ